MFGYGLGILLLVIGAVLKFAFHGKVSNVDVQMIGVILMLAGLASIILSAIFNYMATHRRDRAAVTRHDVVERDERVVRDDRV